MAEPMHKRDHRIDVLRGIALLMIFVNHIPGTLWENFTSRNFGFSDAAEGFVLMSGIAAGLAYGPAFLRAAPGLRAAWHPWRRALTILVVHWVVVFLVLALFLHQNGDPDILAMAERRNILPALLDPVGMILPLMTLGHQFAFADILPVYVVLMLAAPALLFAAARWPWLTMAASVALWFGAAFWLIKVPTWPFDNTWFFNPLSWQLLFVLGVLVGLAVRQGRRLVPVKAWALRLAIAFLAVAAVWVQVPIVADWGGHGLWLLHEYAHVPNVFTAFDKGMLFLPRLLHILALAYVLSALPIVRLWAAHPRLAPLALLGRHSLPVFATGTVMAYAAQVVKAQMPASALLDAALILVGSLVLFLVARLGEFHKHVKPAVMSPGLG